MVASVNCLNERNGQVKACRSSTTEMINCPYSIEFAFGIYLDRDLSLFLPPVRRGETLYRFSHQVD